MPCFPLARSDSGTSVSGCSRNYWVFNVCLLSVVIQISVVLKAFITGISHYLSESDSDLFFQRLYFFRQLSPRRVAVFQPQLAPRFFPNLPKLPLYRFPLYESVPVGLALDLCPIYIQLVRIDPALVHQYLGILPDTRYTVPCNPVPQVGRLLADSIRPSPLCNSLLRIFPVSAVDILAGSKYTLLVVRFSSLIYFTTKRSFLPPPRWLKAPFLFGCCATARQLVAAVGLEPTRFPAAF